MSKKTMKCALILLVINALIFISKGFTQTISDKILQYENPIPSGASQVASGYGWIVYLEETEETDYCRMKICRLFLENVKTGTRYLFLETKGDKQVGTKIKIKARNTLAYGQNVAKLKKTATYKYGYLEAVSEVYVLSPTKILVQGVPDARNIYSYIVDLENYTAVHIDAYSGFFRTCESDGQTLLEFLTNIYTEEGREDAKVLFDFQGNSITDPVKQTYDCFFKDCEMVFYQMGKDVVCDKDTTKLGGNVFVYVPEFGYVGFDNRLEDMGAVSDHQRCLKYATDSCIVHVSGGNIEAVLEIITELQRNIPRYVSGQYDGTSFVMDVADAAGINYGDRAVVRTPDDFMKQLKKYNK